MIPTYLPGAHLRETLASIALARAGYGGPMQVEIVDDASPDCDVAALIASWGFADVTVFRRTRNGGLGECWNTCIDRARGEWIHILHQDDLVAPEYYGAVDALVTADPGVEMVFCRNWSLQGEQRFLSVLLQDEAGPLTDWLPRISAGQLLQCPAASVRRALYRRIGGFDVALRYIIDWEMWIRVAVAARVGYLPTPLATYRVHEGAETQRLRQTGKILPDFILGFERIRATLKQARRSDCIPAAARYAWSVFGSSAAELQGAQRLDGARRHLWSSILHFGPYVGLKVVFDRLRWYLSLSLRSLRSSQATAP